jgi:L-lysine exporter family protein LysE/ArgO
MAAPTENLVMALLAGVVCGFVVSIPVGPVNLTIINYSLRKGFGPAFLVGLGAITAESVYAALWFAGHSTIFDHEVVVGFTRLAAVVLLAGLGVRYLLMRPEKLDASAERAAKWDQRWRHPRAFLLGFALTVSNLLLILLWATMTRVLFDGGWVQPLWPSRTMAVAGVFTGGFTWFFLLAFFVSRAHRRVRDETLTLLVRGSGIVLLAFALFLAYRIFSA